LYKKSKTGQSHNEKSSRNEKGAVVKPRGGRTAVGLVFPGTYYVGMSSLGYQTIYRIINARKDALAERLFLPDAKSPLNRASLSSPITSVESKTRPSDFEILGFSVAFEHDYKEVADFLRLSGIPPFSRDRDESHPLLILGGVCTFFNPEPIADFFDAVIVGEAEESINEFLDEYVNLKSASRQELLLSLSHIPGVYIPSLYTPSYNTDGTLLSYAAASGAPERIVRRYVKDLDSFPAKSAIITSDTEFSDMFMIELSRGCGRHCRFCMAGYVYRPPRSRSFESVKKDIEEGRKLAAKIGLVGSAVSDYPEIARLANEFKDQEINFSASSLRADSLTPELARLVSKGNRTVAIAPEAGSERLRAVINKNISQEQVLSAVRTLIEAGVLNVKLYFMVGLPTERDEDIEEIIALASKAREEMLSAARLKGRMGTLSLSVNCFIPKPWTPFQWEPMETADRLKNKLQHIAKALKGPNMAVTHDVPKYAVLQAALARGDRRLSHVILRASENGGDWKAAFSEEGLDMEAYASRERSAKENFPWDFLDTGIKKDYLLKEKERAGRACHTPRCAVGKCRTCGVC
jgi:radical SAM family uncharacterized protein